MAWLILGAGKSGLAAARLIRKKHPEDLLFLYDDKQKSLSNDKTKELKKLSLSFLSQGQAFKHLQSKIKTLVLSPGIMPSHPLVQKAKKQALEIISEIELALRFWQGKIIAVTGTNGKSTTVEMTAHVLNKCSLPTKSCGNIGTPLSEVVLDAKKFSCLVIELSSYQLELLKGLKADLVLLLNVTADHLERHKTFARYLKIKWSLLKLVKQEGVCFMSHKLSLLAKTHRLTFNPKRTILISQREEEKLKAWMPSSLAHSPHLVSNASFAILACQKMTLEPSQAKLCKLLKTYKHKLFIVVKFQILRVS